MIEKKTIIKACELAKDQLMRTTVTGPHKQFIEMSLPVTYRNGLVAAVFVWPHPESNNKVFVGDGGDISNRQLLTKKEIETICELCGLEHDCLYESDEFPYRCEIYTVVPLNKIGRAVFKIMKAIRYSYLLKECDDVDNG